MKKTKASFPWILKIYENILIKNSDSQAGVVVQVSKPSTQKAEAGGNLSRRPTWTTEGVLREAKLHRGTLSQKKTKKQFQISKFRAEKGSYFFLSQLSS